MGAAIWRDSGIIGYIAGGETREDSRHASGPENESWRTSAAVLV